MRKFCGFFLFAPTWNFITWRNFEQIVKIERDMSFQKREVDGPWENDQTNSKSMILSKNFHYFSKRSINQTQNLPIHINLSSRHSNLLERLRFYLVILKLYVNIWNIFKFLFNFIYQNLRKMTNFSLPTRTKTFSQNYRTIKVHSNNKQRKKINFFFEIFF